MHRTRHVHTNETFSATAATPSPLTASQNSRLRGKNFDIVFIHRRASCHRAGSASILNRDYSRLGDRRQYPHRRRLPANLEARGACAGWRSETSTDSRSPEIDWCLSSKTIGPSIRLNTLWRAIDIIKGRWRLLQRLLEKASTPQARNRILTLSRSQAALRRAVVLLRMRRNASAD